MDATDDGYALPARQLKRRLSEAWLLPSSGSARIVGPVLLEARIVRDASFAYCSSGAHCVAAVAMLTTIGRGFRVGEQGDA
jgi:hypothetical protein